MVGEGGEEEDFEGEDGGEEGGEGGSLRTIGVEEEGGEGGEEGGVHHHRIILEGHSFCRMACHHLSFIMREGGRESGRGFLPRREEGRRHGGRRMDRED